MRRALLTFAAALSCASCHGGAASCTLVACSDQLTVTLGPPVALPYGIDLTLDGLPSTFLCDAQGAHAESGGAAVERCDAASFTVVGAPKKAEVHVHASDFDGGPTDDFNALFTPTYSIAAPNGEGCPPTCHKATVKLL